MNREPKWTEEELDALAWLLASLCAGLAVVVWCVGGPVAFAGYMAFVVAQGAVNLYRALT